MTDETVTGARRIFVPAVLPWLLGAAMFVLYHSTLFHTASSESMNRLADLNGWDWRLQLFAPLTYIATYPIRWLPLSLHLAALNLFAAACATLTLVLLARSVALLPHDRTNEQRLRETSEHALLTGPTAWLAPLFAVLVCGLQMSFWERSVQFIDVSMFDNGEIFNLLLFAYVVRCLLEFRIHDRQFWLSRAALVFGLSMANNWSMICFLPLFLGALIWIKGFDFFDWRFVLRMFLWGLLGLCLIFVLPLAIQFQHTGDFGFKQALHLFLSSSKAVIMAVMMLRKWFLVLAVTSLLPVMLIGVRWATSFGDNSPLGILLASITMTLAHGFFLVCCLWMALDPKFGPRQILIHGEPALPLFYLGALSVGYFTGYFLLVFGRRPVKQRQRTPAVLRILNPAVIVLVLAVLVGASGLLAVKNYSRISSQRRMVAMQADYFAQIVRTLPPRTTAILSDELPTLFNLQAAEIAQGASRNDILIQTAALAQSWSYIDRQDRLHPGENIAAVFTDRKAPGPTEIDCIHLLEQLASRHELFYLHPSFGYYFERFYPEPHGLVYQLKEYPSNSWTPPPLSPEVFAENAAFWQDNSNRLAALLHRINEQPAPATNSWQDFEKSALFAAEGNRTALILGQLYSRALSTWGVYVQRTAGPNDTKKLEQAAACFELAQQLNAYNGPALENLRMNQRLHEASMSPGASAGLDRELPGHFQNWKDQILMGGPFDEPHYLAMFGMELRNGNNLRQAIIAFKRMEQLMPDNLLPPTLLAQTFAMISGTDEAMSYAFPPPRAACSDAIAAADRALRIAPADTNALYIKSLCALRLGAYLQSDTNGSQGATPNDAYTAGLDAANRLIQQAGPLPAVVYLKANALMQLKRYKEAIPLWSDLIKVQTNSPGLYFYRAVANYQTGNYQDAKKDYEVVLQADAHAYAAYFGKAKIAETNKEYAAAITNYELYLSNVPSVWRQSAEYLGVQSRLQELKNSPP